MKGWKDISQDLMEAYYTDIDEVRLGGVDRDAVANVLKELINQFKEVYEIDNDDDEDYPVDFVINVRDIRQLIWELEQ